MSKKLRYILLALGCIVFLTLAPTIVLYVRGVNFDFEKGQFVQTGILALRAEPSDAQVFLDDKFAAEPVQDIKFLTPKEYNISIRKAGFFPWDKRLNITAGQVTWGSPSIGKIFLFKNTSETGSAGNNITDTLFLADKNILASLHGNSLILTSPNNLQNSKTFVLPAAAQNITASPDGQKFVLQTPSAATFYVDSSQNAVIDLSKLFSSSAKWYFTPDNRLYALFGSGFYGIDATGQTKTLLKSGITAVTFLNSDFYFLTQQPDASLSLQVTSDPAAEGQDILKNLPAFKQADIIINPRKQIFLIADGTLYQVGAALEPVAANVADWNFDSARSTLIFFHDGELDYINPFDNSSYFITRRGGNLTNPIVRIDLGYAFFNDNNSIKALELDTRGQQNEYELYRGKDIKKFYLDNDGKNLVVLDDDTVKLINIR